MDFLKMKKFIRSQKPSLEINARDKTLPQPEEPKDKNVDDLDKAVDVDTSSTEAEDDDDDFITNEVKRRLKELRRKSFMALIPEEASPEDGEDVDEEEGDTSSSEWRDVQAEGQQFWSIFDALYDTYSERMLFFDRLIAQQLHEVDSHVPSSPSPRSSLKRLRSPFKCLSLKTVKEPEGEMEYLQPQASDPYEDLETAYVGQTCLTWEALHCQYTQLSQKISCGLETSTSYNQSAQQFQQFEVLLQRFIENEPFEQGSRPEIYARMRNSLPKLLQVPKVQGSDQKSMDEESDLHVLAPNLITIIESSILTFHQFLKTDKKKSGGVRSVFGSQDQMVTPLQQIQSSLEKKALKLKEQRKRTKSWKKKAWPSIAEDVDLLLGTIDVKVLSRVVRMVKMSKGQLFWCEEKMKRIDCCGGKLERDPSPILFPC
ncbi:uncharacterized protein LOC113768599 [Coffea eugenioides]|uniref:Uncharacterized protein n=1 Tax=Coffea arabica TaxID=13443 RepID=A0A6P6X4D3_COFAR|nr:uncharacterized protein LOC113738744 [Coffea arabica]XP_027168825.1 uncharacterized protein LOC113768599 [Coffea eugenioides]